MSDDTSSQPLVTSDKIQAPTGNSGVEEILKEAQAGKELISVLAEEVKATAADTSGVLKLVSAALTEVQTKLSDLKNSETTSTESQRLITAILIEVQAKLADIKISETTATESKGLIAAALTVVQSKLADVNNATTQALAAMTKIVDDQAVIATKSDHIQGAQEHADKVRADLDRALTAATQQVTTAEGYNTRAQTASESATTLFNDIQTTKGTVETDAVAIVATRKTAEESTAQIKVLADKSSNIETRIAEYEKSLAELKLQCEIQLKTITDLLPGATSAGLAHAFDDRRQTFLKPQNLWQWVFIGSLSIIIMMAISSLWSLYHSNIAGIAPTYDDVLRMWLSRLPVAGALIWLALHASRESALAKRLEEDYGYKSAVASSFQGFHKQMSEIGPAAVGSPLAQLCGDTLTTISSPPGRIYDKHKLTVSPTDELTEFAKAAIKAAIPKISIK